MKTRIQETVLSDGSKVYALIIQGSGKVMIDCESEDSAFALQECFDACATAYDVDLAAL